MTPDSLYITNQIVENQTAWDLIAKISTIIISLLNLLLVLYFFYSTRKYNLRALIFEKKSIWFRELAIEPNIEKINNFYENVGKILEKGQTSILIAIKENRDHKTVITLSKKTINEFLRSIIELRKGVIDIVFAMDQNFGNTLLIFIDELQDSINPKFDDLISKGEKCECNFHDLIREHKIELFKKLYNYETIDLIAPINKR